MRWISHADCQRKARRVDLPVLLSRSCHMASLTMTYTVQFHTTAYIYPTSTSRTRSRILARPPTCFGKVCSSPRARRSSQRKHGTRASSFRFDARYSHTMSKVREELHGVAAHRPTGGPVSRPSNFSDTPAGLPLRTRHSALPPRGRVLIGLVHRGHDHNAL